MRKIFYILNLLSFMINVSSAEQQIQNEDSLLPEVQEMIKLQPVSKEEIRNSIYAGIYGFFAPKDNPDFLDYGADFLFDYNNEIQRLLKAGDNTALINFIKKNNYLNETRLIKPLPKKIYRCLDNIKPKCFEELRSDRATIEQYINNEQYLLDRYIALQSLDQNLDLYFLPHLVINDIDSYSTLSRVMNASFKIRLLQVFYLLEDNKIEDALNVLLSEKQFYERLLTNRKSLEVYAMGSTDFGLRELTDIDFFISTILDESYFKDNLLNPKLTQLILFSPHNLGPSPSAILPMNIIKHQILAKYYLNDFNPYSSAELPEFTYNYPVIKFQDEPNTSKNDFLNTSYNALKVFYEPLMNKTMQPVTFFHSVVGTSKWDENELKNIKNIDSKRILDEAQIDIIQLFVFDSTYYFSINQLLRLKYLILISGIHSNEVENYLVQLGDLSINPYTNTRVLWNDKDKVIYTKMPLCSWIEKTRDRLCNEGAFYKLQIEL